MPSVSTDTSPAPVMSTPKPTHDLSAPSSSASNLEVMKVSYILNEEETNPIPQVMSCTESVYNLYIHNLRLLLQAYQKSSPYSFFRSLSQCTHCLSSPPGTPEYRGITGECSIRTFILDQTGIIDAYYDAPRLPVNPEYLEEIAQFWLLLPVEDHWIFVWEHVARCTLADLWIRLKKEREKNITDRSAERRASHKTLSRYQLAIRSKQPEQEQLVQEQEQFVQENAPS